MLLGHRDLELKAYVACNELWYARGRYAEVLLVRAMTLRYVLILNGGRSGSGDDVQLLPMAVPRWCKYLYTREWFVGHTLTSISIMDEVNESPASSCSMNVS